MVSKESSEMIGGKFDGKHKSQQKIHFCLGGITYVGFCDLSSSINIMPYTIYEEMRDHLDESYLEPSEAAFMFSNRTLHPTRGILCNVFVFVGAFVYPVDFHIIEIPLNSYGPVIFGNCFYNSMNIDIDNKKQALYL